MHISDNNGFGWQFINWYFPRAAARVFGRSGDGNAALRNPPAEPVALGGRAP
jgi:hypothetical protein